MNKWKLCVANSSSMANMLTASPASPSLGGSKDEKLKAPGTERTKDNKGPWSQVTCWHADSTNINWIIMSLCQNHLLGLRRFSETCDTVDSKLSFRRRTHTHTPAAHWGEWLSPSKSLLRCQQVHWAPEVQTSPLGRLTHHLSYLVFKPLEGSTAGYSRLEINTGLNGLEPITTEKAAWTLNRAPATLIELVIRNCRKPKLQYLDNLSQSLLPCFFWYHEEPLFD